MKIKKKAKQQLVVLLAITLLFGVGLFGYQRFQNSGAAMSDAAYEFQDYDKQTVSIGKQTYTLYIADTNQRRAQGLSDISTMDKTEGMAFVFNQPMRHSFWMKGMRFSLDFVYVRNGVVVDLIENVAPSTYPESIQPQVSADTVIELHAGQIKSSSVKHGDEVVVK